MKYFLSAFFLFFISISAIAQNAVNNEDVIIHIRENDVLSEYSILIDIYKKGNSVKIEYAFGDTIHYQAVQRKPRWQALIKRLDSYKPNDPQIKPIEDTINSLFVTPYVRASKRINLKSDTAYQNLLQRIASADKEEFIPKTSKALANGSYIIHGEGPQATVAIITSSPYIKVVSVNTPLMVNFIKQTLSKKRDSKAVEKIIWYDPRYK